MSTLDKSESSRRNGAKSRGPITPEGKERSSRNALKFGLYAKRVMALSTEQQHQLDALRTAYFEEWLPQNRTETDLVEKLVDAEWRYLRYSAMEKWLLEDMMSQMRIDVLNMFDVEPDMDLRAALAYDRLYKESPALETFQRERHRLARVMDRLTRLLLDLRQDRADDNPPAAENHENEPETPLKSTLPPGIEPANTTEPAARSWFPHAPFRPSREIEPPEVALAVAS